MKYFICIICIPFIVSCSNNPKTISDRKKNNTIPDSVYTFSFVTNFDRQNIFNSSDRQIDILFNSHKHYSGEKNESLIQFNTECMSCEEIQEFMGGLLFAKRLLIFTDKIKYYNTDVNINDNVNLIKFVSGSKDNTDSEFNFSAGKGSILNVGVSCNDADYYKVRLLYSTGEIVIDSLINASLFEYDLDRDGQKEQYLFSTRNCSQELVIFRIKKSNVLK